MASNKKAQILAAVMCASSIFGSYTMVSAADATANVDKVNGKITATAKNNDNQQSTITLQGNNFNVSVGGAATSSLALKDGTFTLNSKNLKIDSNNGLRIYDGTNTSPTATITKAGVITGTGLTIKNGTTTLASLNNSGLIVNGTSNINSTGTNANSGKSAKSTVSYSSGVQDTVTNGAYKTTSTVAATGVTDSLEKMNGLELENKVSSTLNASGLTTTVQSKGAEAGIENINSTKNKTISAVAYNSVTDTVYDANGKKTSYSNVGTTSITDTVYANNGSSTLASSTLKKSTAINEDVTTESGSVELTANKITTNGEETTTLTSKLNLTGDSASLTSGSASVKVDNATGNVAITANQKGSQGYVTLSGKNVNLSNNTFSLKNTTTGKDIAKIDSYGLNVNGTGTSSIKSTNSTTGAYVKNEITSGAMTTTARGGKWPSESDNVNKTTSQVSATGVRDNVYDDGGQIKATSSVTTSGIANTVNNSSITNTVNDVNTGKALANSRLTTSGISNTTTDLAMTGNNIGNKMTTALNQNSGGISASATKKYEDGTTTKTSLTLDGDSAKLYADTSRATVQVYNTTGNVDIKAGTVNGVQGNVTLSGKNVNLGNNTFSLKNTTTGKDIAKIDSYGLNVNGTGTSSIKSTNSTTGAYVKNEITSGAMTTTARGGKWPSESDNVNKTTSQVSATGVRDNVYDDGGQIKATSSVTTSGIANTVNNSSITNTVNDVNTGKPLADSRLTTSGISNTTTALQMTGTNAGNTMSTGIYQNNGGISATATKKDVDGNTIGISTLSLGGNSASLKVGNYGFAVDSSNNVSITGNNATLSGNKLTLTDVTTGKTATLDTNGLSLKDANGTQIGGVSAAGAVSGTSLSIKAPIDPLKPNNDYIESKVTTSGVADTIKQGGFTRATSNVAINSIKDTIYTNDGKELSSSNISKSVSDATESGSVTLIANKITTNDDATTTTLTSKLNLTGDSATLTSGSAYVKADNTTGNVLFSGKNVSLSGSTFTLKDVTNGKTLASLGDRGLSLNKVNSDGTTINYGTWNSNGLTLKDTNGKTATLTTSGLTLKDEDGNTTGGISTTGAVTGTSLNITAKNTAGNKTTSTVGATGVTDRVYDTDGTTQVAYSNVGTGGISNTTSLKTTTGKIDTAINQNTSGVGISSTKYDTNNNVTDKTSLTMNGSANNITSIKYNDSNKTTETTSVSVNGATSSITSYGNYVYDDESGKATSYNQASMSLNGNTGTATIRGGSNTASSTLTLNEAGVALSGKNASLGTSGLSLKDITSGKSVASLGTSGLSLNKVNSDGTTANYGTWNSSGLTVTATNTTGNKTISQVSATGVTDRVYDTDGKTQVAYSSVGTGGISNTTTALQMTGTNAGNTMSTGIYQNNGGISATATKKDVDGNTIGISTLSLGGNSASLKVGNYGFAVDSSNNVSISGNNATLSGSTFTLKDVNTGKTAILNTNGLTLKDGDGTITGGISTTGAVTGTSLRITTSEDAGGNKTVSTVATNAVTDTVTNTKTNNKTTSQVSATGVRDTVYDANNKTVASSTVTTSGISNNTNISGIAIKDDKYNTKTMNTSIAQNANGVSISSNKYNVYNDGTNTVQTTDGTSTISVNGAKTTISGYGYKYEKDENGKPILDEKGNPIRSSYTNASLSVDGESGIIGLSGKNVGLSANGLTLYKDVEGVKTQYASLTAGGLNVNGTGYTTIKSTNATTGAMGQSQVSYNGVTDTVTNAAGNKTTSTVSATGTIDQVYDTDGKTRIAYSNVTTNGITDSFTKDGVTNSVTTNANGTTFASTGNGTTTIKGGSITTNSITVAGNTIDGGFFDTIGETNSNTAGIVRTEINGDWITSIEGAINISRSGNISLNADKLTYSYNDGKNSGTLGALANKVDDIYDRTQGIDYDKATGTTTIDGNLSVKDETTTGGTAGSTGETGTTPINGNITANTANIGGVQMGKNAVTATTGNFENITVGGTEGTSINKDGVTVGDKKSDNYTSITNNDVIVNNNGNKTSLADVGNRVTGLESSVNSMNNRLSDVEDRIDKVGAMSAAIANLRTMGFDPEAPTEIAIGVGQYKSETGLALGVFHYPNQDFMLSASISTSGDEVMGGIGATWKLGRKSAAEKAKDEEARRLEKAEEMKKLAQDAKVKAQAERHAKLLAEREAQKTA